MLEFLVTYIKVRIEDANERGASAVEYGMLIALIAAIIVGLVATVGTQVKTAFSSLAGKF
jgi:pilus assembly protein Flp/PilA